jgi:hypothetical protein
MFEKAVLVGSADVVARYPRAGTPISNPSITGLTEY